MPVDATLDWLLAGDPAIRWQALRDLKGASPRTVARERRRVTAEGWGARLLALQDADGRWERGLYTPKWTSTTYTLLLLRDCGVAPDDARCARGCAALLDGGCWSDGGINFYAPRHKRSETCISSMALALASYFRIDDARVDALADYVLGQQLRDGGWNCRATATTGGATHSSFHTTISALEALLEYERFRPARARAARVAQARGREFFLIHRIYKSHRTGEIVKPAMTRFHFPPRWHFDVLRGLDYFRECAAPKDERLRDAIGLLAVRERDGRWQLGGRYAGKTFFEMESAREPSRWITLRARRVLRWWNS